MNVNASDLLRKLAGAGAVGGAAAPCRSCASEAAPSANASSFEALLRSAQRGELSSGRSVGIGPGAGVELSAEQLGRLAPAVDAAEAAGAQRLLAIVDGVPVKIDVVTREITGGGASLRGPVVTDIDAVVVLDGADGHGVTGVGAAGAANAGSGAGLGAQALASLESVRNGSLASLLERSGTPGRAA